MKDSKIGWCHHSFNPWWGCAKVSPGCLHCFAEMFAKRTGNAVWGEKSPRRFFGDKHWNEPRLWNEEAKRKGIDARVFCASMADVYEDREDLIPQRERLFGLIEETPHLIWMLLTKRPQNIRDLTPRKKMPSNVWLGTTAENQEMWDERLPLLKSVKAAVHFVSAEPLLGPVRMGRLRPDWLIVGGENGPGARPMQIDWARNLRDQCDNRTVFYFKQKGGFRNDETKQKLDGKIHRGFPKPSAITK